MSASGPSGPLVTRYSDQDGWGMSVFLKGCNFEHTKLSIHF